VHRAALALAFVAAASCEKGAAPRGDEGKPGKPAPAHPTVAQANTIPSALEASFRGSSGPVWSVAMEGSGAITWRFAADKRSTIRVETASVPVARWKAMRRALDEAGAFDLEPTYRGTAPEGDDWTFSVEFADRRVAARGKDGGKPEGEVLEKILAAMNALTGNKLRPN
jgi:hypothetical protein